MNNQRSVLLLCLGLFLCFQPLHAQKLPAIEQARQFINSQAEDWQLRAPDVKDLRVSDHYSDQSGVQHIYFQQYYEGIPIYNAITNISINPQGETFTIGKTRFINHLATKVSGKRPSILPQQAIAIAIAPKTLLPELKSQFNSHSFLFHQGDIAAQDIPVDLEYYPDRQGLLHLSWVISLQEKDNSDWWIIHIDALNGQVLHKSNLTLYCTFEQNAYHNHDSECREPSPTLSPASSMVPNSYRVFPFPGESPNHTSHQIVTDPADPVASPFGWHDTDGQAGAEYTITRGNNAHAYTDHLNQNVPQGGEPNGGNDLIFDFPYAPEAPVTQYSNAATVNLFYAVNSVHDFYYHYGFDEAAGNFQAKNYTGMGQEQDYVWAQAQDGYLVDSVNNANFTAPIDGQIGRMQMYMWTRNVGGGSKYLTVLEPAAVAGEYGGLASTDDNLGFGPPPPAIPIVAEVVEVRDGKYNPYTTDACEDIQNAAELAGKIALIDRGGCTYESKVIRAEAAGAVAVIICNFQEDPVAMQGTIDPDPGIPSIMIGSIDCQTIRQYIGTGLTVSFGQPSASGPDYLDGDFDNGIIAHEYGHGISTRITGGPGNSGCLGNPDFNNNGIPDDTEQMGEGWSDFFALAMTVQAGDEGTMRRGIGSFINRQNTEARGIRRYPYSTDMAINPLTYGDVAGDPETHRLGEVWAAVLWDLYWAMVEEYNFDPDLINGNGGNNKVLQLVVEALKIQPCQPGFIDGRDAIIAADKTINNGANECLIWKVFARRGMGYLADQGDPNDPGDQVENFEPLPTCIPELKLTKTVSPTVDAGDIIDVEVVLTNHKPGAASNVVISDELPAGLTFVSGSANFPAQVQGNMVLFEMGTLTTNQEIKLNYKLRTSLEYASKSLLYLDCESTDNWLTEEPEENNFNKWSNTTQTVYNGSKSWRVRAIAAESRQSVFMQFPFEVNAANPVVRFFHSYLTEGGQDAGIVQISTDEEAEEWTDLPDAFLRNGYTGPVNYLTFVIPNLYGFSGNSNGFQASYIDLSAYSGQKIRLRFNFATSTGNGLNAPASGFWAFDDVEFFDLVNYDTEVIATSDEGDQVSVRAGKLGTVVLGDLTPVKELTEIPLHLSLFPNPARQFVDIQLSNKTSTEVLLSLVTLTGQDILQKAAVVDPASQTIRLDLKGLANGIYFIKAQTNEGLIVKKIILEGI